MQPTEAAIKPAPEYPRRQSGGWFKMQPTQAAIKPLPNIPDGSRGKV